MGPIRGQTRPVPVEAGVVAAQQLDAKLNASIHNRFDVEVVDAATGKIKQRAQAENVICNQLWTRMLTPAAYFNYIHYGTGSGTPTANDTSLFTFSGYGTPSTADDVYSGDYATGVASLRRKIQLSETTAVGATLTEVGIGYGTTAATLCTHAMLKDMSGNQISITKTATDIVNIYATVFLHYGAGYDSNNIKVIFAPGATSLCKFLLGLRAIDSFFITLTRGNFYLQRRFTYDFIPDDRYSTRFAVKPCTVTFNSSLKTVSLTTGRLAATEGNEIKGVRLAQLSACLNADKTITPGGIIFYVGGSWFAGTAVTGEAIGTGDGSKKDYSTAFPLICDATVYLNGAPVSGVTVDASLPNLNNHGEDFFEFVSMHGANGMSVVNGAPSMACMVNGSSAVYDISCDVGSSSVWYNPLYTRGIASYSYSGEVTVSVSDDMVEWTDVPTTVPTNCRNKKYWKITAGNAYAQIYNLIPDIAYPVANIHFDTAPASGAVITADYTSKTIAKDANHVFDLTVTIQLGEYTG